MTQMTRTQIINHLRDAANELDALALKKMGGEGSALRDQATACNEAVKLLSAKSGGRAGSIRALRG